MTKRSKIVPKWLDLSPTNRQQSTATAKEEWTEQKLDRLLDMLIREGLVEGELGSVVPAEAPLAGDEHRLLCMLSRQDREKLGHQHMTGTSVHTGDMPPSHGTRLLPHPDAATVPVLYLRDQN